LRSDRQRHQNREKYDGGFHDLTHMTRLRQRHKGHGLMEGMTKQTVNSLYGKLAQSIRPGRAFDSANGATTALAPSQISNEFIAAHTTG
jgi:hypothetical protein